MKDYYDIFVKLSLQQCTKNDYADKLKIKAHNAALKKMQHLKNEMVKFDCTEILGRLLTFEDDRVKINAASLCLQRGILVDKAVLVLKNIVDSSDDLTMCFSAKIMLSETPEDTGDGSLFQNESDN